MSTSLSTSEDTGRRFFTRRADVGTGEAVKAVVTDLSALVKAEVALAKAEVVAAVKPKATAAGMLVGAAVCGWLAVQGLLIALGLALALVVPGWAAALIVVGLLLLVAAVLGLVARGQLAKPASVEVTKENVQRDLAETRAHLPGGGGVAAAS